MRVVLGITGGIAAYKACTLLRLFTEDGHDVTVVPTRAALEFVGRATWAALSGKPVRTEVFEDVAEVPHVRLGRQADLVVVAPATADFLARAAAGIADDLLSNTLLTTRAPVVLAPAMHTEMWEHPATQANVATLRARGVHIVDPASGRLTGLDTGAGRLPEPAELYARVLAIAAQSPAGAPSQAPSTGGDLNGIHLVVTAGGTREPLDPVRYLGNRSSGKQGYAVAAAALRRGAAVTLVSANVALPVPPGASLVPVATAQDMAYAVGRVFDDVEAIVMAAAVADFRPAHYAASKIKKDYPAGGAATEASDEGAPGPTIELVRNPDILAGLVARRGPRPGPVIVGFAAETGDEHGTVVDHARAKLIRKGCDAIIANEVGVDKTFGSDSNTIHVLRRDRDDVVTVGPATKDIAADTVCAVVRELVHRQ